MQIDSTAVALSDCKQYSRKEIAETVKRICEVLHFKVTPGTRVLIKPNLLSGRSAGHLACTHPEFIAAVAEWFIDQAAVVTVGDSPAFGTAQGVMRAIGADRALAGLPVKCIDFDRTTFIKLAGGVKVNVASAALECDLLVNLPRVKAHSQFYMTLAVKNYFGTVTGFQKAGWHMRYGDKGNSFASHLVDLLAVLPSSITFVDGIVAMHETGPINGSPFSLGLIGGAINPVALDTAIFIALGLADAQSGIWRECVKRNFAGADPDNLDFPLLQPSDFHTDGFRPPSMLQPESFNPLRWLVSGCRRIAARLKEST
jgi:uncharacterized protein (DUF362 family)